MRSGGAKPTKVGREIAWLCTAFVAWTASPSAWAGPPLISDDPGTVGPGNVEAILAFQTAGQRGSDVIDAPVLDLTIGLLDGLDFTLVTGPTHVADTGEPFETSGNLVTGLKWQPIDTDRLTASLTPAIGLDLLSAEQFFFYLPLQVEYAIGRGAIGVDVGYQFVRKERDGWNGSLYGTWQALPKLQLLAEVWALSSPVIDGTDFGTGVGIDWWMRDDLELLAMIGTGIGSTGAKRVEWVGYLGVRWSFRLFGGRPGASAVSRRASGRARLASRATRTR